MVPLASLWLPILVSAVVVYIASSIVWMFLPHHKSDWSALPGEDGLLEAMRRAGVGRGQYRFPFCNPRDKSPETVKKLADGPMGTMIIWPPGPMKMGKQLGTWFVYLLVVSTCVAYLASHALPVGSGYRGVFRVAGGIAILAYASAIVPNAIWWGRSWSSTLKELIDGIAYGLLTAGVFGWLWPR
jgi:hypothetical protein